MLTQGQGTNGANVSDPNAPSGSPGGQAGSSAVGQGGPDDKNDTVTSSGAATDVKTPYTEVIGDYTERATEAMDRAYIPADAKEYVKDYCTGLAK